MIKQFYSLQFHLALVNNVKWFQVLLYINNNSIKQLLFVYTLKWSNSFIWPIDTTLSGDTSPGQSWPKSDGDESVLRTPQSFSIMGSSPSDLVSYAGYSLVGIVLPLCRDTCQHLSTFWLIKRLLYNFTQSAGIVEYTDCFSAER